MIVRLTNRAGRGYIDVVHDPEVATHVDVRVFDDQGRLQADLLLPVAEWKRMCAAFALGPEVCCGRDER